MPLSFLSALALFASAPDATNARTAQIDEQLQCVLQGYSEDSQRDLDAWLKAYEYGKKQAKPVNLAVSLERAKLCKEELSWSSLQETMAAFHATFSLEESAAIAAMPAAKENATAFNASLDEKETDVVQSALTTITSGMITAVGDDKEPGFVVLLAIYALDQKIDEKLPGISDDDKSQLTFLLITETSKDMSRQLFEKETFGDASIVEESDEVASAPSSGPPSESPPRRPQQQEDRIPTPTGN